MRVPSTLFTLAILSQLGATDCGQVIRDSSFDLWCGEDLCAWKITRGEVKRVPTWNEGDSGVELVGADVAIQQLAPVNSNDGDCIKFELIANVQDSAEVYLNVDVEGDGTLEMHERLPTANWKPLSYNFLVAKPYDGIRFELTKRGQGRAMLANIGAELAGGKCAGLTPLDPGPRRNGAICADVDGTTCASGLCTASPTYSPAAGWLFDFVCAGCDPEAPACGAGEVCGLGDAFSPVFAVPVECVPAARKELGEKCLSDAECGSNICMRAEPSGLGVCSACRVDADCTGGQLCASTWWPGNGPWLCGANARGAASGAPCGTDDDCATGTCNGAVRAECEDHRTCISPADCPFGIGDADPLQNGSCSTVGIQGGTCE